MAKYTKPSQVLRAAKKRLAKTYAEYYTHYSGNRFICCAVGEVDADQTLTRQCTNHITELLKGHGSYETWLWHTHGINAWGSDSFDKLMKSRHAWLNDMIKHFEAQGK